jgi:hypothetical protein
MSGKQFDTRNFFLVPEGFEIPSEFDGVKKMEISCVPDWVWQLERNDGIPIGWDALSVAIYHASTGTDEGSWIDYRSELISEALIREADPDQDVDDDDHQMVSVIIIREDVFHGEHISPFIETLRVRQMSLGWPDFDVYVIRKDGSLELC